MSDDVEPDSENLDEILKRDAANNPADERPLGTGHDPFAEPDIDTPSDQKLVNRLLTHSAQIGNNLRQAFDSIRATRSLTDLDSESCTKLTNELDQCEKAVISLEQVLDDSTRPAASKTSEVETDVTAAPNDKGGYASLVARLEAQAAVIDKLEAQLQRLQEDSNLPAPLEHDEDDAELMPGAAVQTLNRLIITTGDTGNLKFPLHKPIMTIGRAPQNDIHIRSRFISRFHARIVSDKTGATIEDLDSRNGISVNSTRTRRQSLSSGDRVDIGRTQLKYIDLSEGSSGEGEA